MNLIKKIFPYLVLLIIGSLLGYAIYRHGYTNGANKIKVQWQQEQAEVQNAFTGLLIKTAKLGEAHRLEQEKITNELQKLRETHVSDLAQQRSAYEQRLLQSSRRAAVYERQAQAGEDSRRDLASHAAELDRTLEEGRELVKELGTTLRLREDQLKLLGEQMLNDRRFVEGQSL